MTPVGLPLHMASVAETVVTNGGPADTITFIVLVVQPPPSLTTTVWIPAGTLLNTKGDVPGTGVPPSRINEKGAAPPLERTVIVPLLAPLQEVAAGVALAVKEEPEPMLIFWLRIQPIASVIVTAWVPGVRLVNVQDVGDVLTGPPSMVKR